MKEEKNILQSIVGFILIAVFSLFLSGLIKKGWSKIPLKTKMRYLKISFVVYCLFALIGIIFMVLSWCE